MSIWCSWDDIKGRVRAYASGWSNHYPTEDVEPPATVSVAHVAPWCTPGWEGHEMELDNGQVGGWLRLTVDSPDALTWWGKVDGKPRPEPAHVSVVLDEEAVRALRDDLTLWLGYERLEPRVATLPSDTAREVTE